MSDELKRAAEKLMERGKPHLITMTDGTAIGTTGGCQDLVDAGTTILALIAERDRLREALAPFAKAASTRVIKDGLSFAEPDLEFTVSRGCGHITLTAGDFNAARKALR